MSQVPQLTPEEEQEKLVEEAKNVVNVQAFYMKRCLDNGKLMDALKHASNMISELRTSLLTPKTYYGLYMAVFDHMRHLESYLFEEKHGKRMAELYELVQYAGNILPRLYLLATVGSVYIKSKEAPAKDVLRDLVEMCRGVQHPTRGLFLRNYLSEMCKDKVPDLGTPYEGRGGGVADAVDFILQNFTEMNKLWVRMQHQGPVRDKERRETERLELRILVGKNLSRMSQLDGVDAEMYKTVVLPRVLEQIINCKDRIAQQYLMEVVIQVFPDEFHLATLEQILAAASQLQIGVDVKAIVVSLIDRLAQYAIKAASGGGHTSLPNEIDIFRTFFVHIGKMIETRANMEVPDVLTLQVSLMNLSLKCYPGKLSYVDEVLGHSASYLEALDAKEKMADYKKPASVKQIMNLLTIPIESYKDILTVLKLTNYQRLNMFLSYTSRKKVATDLIKNAVENETIIGEPDQVEKLLECIQPLIKDDESKDAEEVDKEDFEEEQRMVASLVHMFDNSDPGLLYKIYMTARRHFTQGGQSRTRHTLVPLVFRALRLVCKIRDQRASGELQLEDDDWAKIGKKLFQFAHETITLLAENKKLSELAMRLFLQAAHAADCCAFEVIAYELLTQAFTLYEQELEDAKQFGALSVIIGTLQTLTSFSDDNWDTLASKAAKHSTKLLKKTEQAAAVATVSHLFWITNPDREHKDGKRVFECLKKSIELASDSMDPVAKVNTTVRLLNEYLYYFDNQNSDIPSAHISALVQLINTDIANMDNQASESTATNTFFQNTLRYIQQKKETDSSYVSIEV